MASVYRIHLWYNYTTRFSHDMFRHDGAILRYVGVHTISFFFLLLSPLASVHTLRVRGIYVFLCSFFVNYIVYGMCKILNYYLN
jgi:hypothetical protein